VASEVLVQSAFGKLDIDKLTTSLSCPQGKLLVTLAPNTNSLGIDGSAQLDKTHHYLVNANIVPPTNASTDYLNVLDFTGTPNNKGEYIFQYKGSL
jgi:general secretion pathway protein N